MRLRQFLLACVDVALLVGLDQAVLGHQRLGARLLQRLRADEVLPRQVDGAGQLLASQIGVGFGGLEFAQPLRAALGHVHGHAFDVVAQRGERLASAHAVAPLDVHLLDHAHDRAAEVGHAERLDQASQRLRRPGVHGGRKRQDNGQQPGTNPVHPNPQRLKFSSRSSFSA